MKLTIIIVLVAILGCSTFESFSQSNRLSLEVKNKKIEDCLKEIEDLSVYRFFYSGEIDVDKKVTGSFKNNLITEILDKIFENTTIQYRVSGRQIILSNTTDLKNIIRDLDISGKVTNTFFEPIPGVTVIVNGATYGTITDIDGNYNLKDVPSDATLTFSFVGMKTQEVKVNNRALINIKLAEETIGLEEVIAVGYGTQKKVNLTGAVDQVGNEMFENRPMPNATRGLQGLIPNLNIDLGDGKPLREATYNVRGTTSIGAGGGALVLIDGIPGDPNLINPSDIESISVLKDAASAAIYGARGSFGVVLITTKKAKEGKIEVKYSGNFSFKDRTVKPDLITDGYEWARTFDEAYNAWNDYKTHPQKANSVFPFSLSYLDELKKRQDDPNLPLIEIDPTTGEYVYYGSTDWLKELYVDVIPATEHSLVISGNKDKASFYISAHYSGQGGIFRYNPDKYKMYNLRAKQSLQVSAWLRLENDFAFSSRIYYTPILNHPSDTPVYRRVSDEAFPIAMLRNPDGTLTQNASIVFGSFISGNNYQDFKKLEFINTSRFKADCSKNLSLSGDFTFKRIPSTQVSLYTPVPYSPKPGVISERGESKMRYWDDKSNYIGINIYTDYSNQFGDHSVNGLIGYNYENSDLKELYLMRYGVINPELPDFSLINGENFTMEGGGEEWKTMGSFFRFNYHYKEKYLFEMNGRYDGSSKFPIKQQFGFFPSFSGGWRISEEPFWRNMETTIQNLKVRLSYGSLGNGNVDPYNFIETMSVSKSDIIIGGILPNKTQKPAVIPDGLTWEKVTSLNGGFDLGLFNNRLQTTFDFYHRYTIGMFTTGTPVPAVFGATVPKGNYADLKTVGWELVIQWNDQINFINPVKYDLRFTLSDYIAHVTKYNNPHKLIDSYYEGSRVGDIWGYVNDGYFMDENDIFTHADQSYIRASTSGSLLPGDIKFKDLNNDGAINPGNSTVDDPGDLKIVGNETPRYHFGISTNVDWNNFFFSVFFQGIGKRDYWPGIENSLFWGAYNRPYSFHPKWVEEEMWSEDNPDTYFPRLRGYVANATRGELVVIQSKYIQNAAYIRLKNLTLGYSLPKSFVNKLNLSDVKFYFNGQNLWVYSPMFKRTKDIDPEVLNGSDPETANDRGNGMRYPMLKSYTLGINVTF